MTDSSVGSTKVEVTLRLSEFEMPKMQDAIIIGRKAPIGFEAARRIVNILFPNQYEVIRMHHPAIEAVIIRKSLTEIVGRDKLVSLILEEGGKAANEATILQIQLNVALYVSKAVEI